MKTFRISFFLLVSSFVFLFSSCSTDEVVQLDSPDGRNNIVFILKDGIPFYKIMRDNRVIIDTSGLGFDLKDMPSLRGNFKMEQATLSGDRERWEPAWGQRNRIRDHHSRLLVTLKEQVEPHRIMQIEFKAFDDGVGFRYLIPEQTGLARLEIMREATEFCFTEDMSAWWIPGNYDEHEFLYRNTPLSRIDSANTPLTMESADSLCLSIHEASLVNYPEMRLKRASDEPLKLLCDLVPWPDGIKAKVDVPFKTPWRTVQLADEAGGLIESTMILNLNEPSKVEDVSWIRPMKYVGIWWGPKHGASTEYAKAHIDFAAENGIPGVLVEGWNKVWENWVDGVEFPMMEAYDDYDLEEVAAYAKNKGVYLIAHNETAGNAEWYEKQVDSAFSLYERLGIHAVKTGYVGKIRPLGQYHHGQWMVNHQAMVVEKAAQRKIMVDAHETVKATGLERTWPNFMTRGWAKDYEPDNRIHTTLVKQLALMVVIYSPMQMVADWITNPLEYMIEKKLLKKDDEFVMKLAAGGGQAIIIRPLE